MYSEKLFRRPKKTILEKGQRFFAIILSEMIWEMLIRESVIFCLKTVKYVINSIDKLPRLRKVSCESDIA